MTDNTFDYFVNNVDHVVKSWPQFFTEMVDGNKLHDMRDMRDRDYQVDQTMMLREFCPFGGGYTGRYLIAEITYITNNTTPCAMSSAALDRNFAILSLKVLTVRTQDPSADCTAVAASNSERATHTLN